MILPKFMLSTTVQILKNDLKTLKNIYAASAVCVHSNITKWPTRNKA